MEEEQNNFDRLFADTKDYLETRLELAKLQAVEKTSEIASTATAGALLLLLFTIVFLFGSIALAFYISEWTGKYSTGFLSVAGIYVFIGLLIYLTRDSLIKIPVTNLMIKKMLKDDE